MPEHDPNDVDNEGYEEESGGIDLERIRELVGFVLRAVRRRLKLAVATFLVIAMVGVGIAAIMPRTYTAQVKLLAQRTSTIRMLSSSNPGMDSVDNPTKNIAPMIMRRDNLLALARDAHLVERFESTRPLALRLKDKVTAKLFGGAPAPEDRLLIMALTLETKIDISVTDDGIVVIAVDWSDPQDAYNLATLVQKNFLEARYDSDVAAINESIAVLNDHAKTELDKVDAELEDYQKVVAARAVAAPSSASGATRTTPSVARASASAPAVDPDVTRALEEKRGRIRELEAEQQKAAEGARAQLLQAQLTLTPMHPTVISLQQRVAAMSEPTPELLQLRSEERALMAQIVPPRPMPIASLLAHPSPASSASSDTASADLPPAPSAVPLPATGFGQMPDGPLQLAQSKLEAAIREYQMAVARSDAAKVELDITRAAYKHRYTIYTPAEVPRRPKKATAQLVAIGSVVGATLLAILLATLADMGTGVVLEPWQVRRRLKLEVIGELDNPS